ncbi:dipeptidyl aminopeptidase/acylaminoacyl peptidase [Catenuloplanes nepalensis]|uniref:Dipeptidyl aminopeptidase/acylaminoacyl peptidase n=1 Tax=Catenuloplanes nepalensis TaxID=587533 RepID=A0ABT9MN90_9ACTN|nr:S9 family peptidase [Catenuloplanes nepalensis]MDP9792753.1 dipeptidyl aminopeptidase/acylaminoacyl peptidase [Catenuloplanes nepalensis]
MIVDTDSSFADLDVYAALPRIGGLRLSPDGSRIVVGVATPDPKKNRYVTALWEVDPAGERPARRLTRSRAGESAAGFTPDGDLLFVSSRPEQDAAPDAAEDGDETAALWRQPAGGGDARVVVRTPGGVRGVSVADDGGLVFGSALLPSSTGLDDDRERRKQRRDAGVTAILHEEFPVRFWDHDLGPARTRLLARADVDEGDLRDLTGHAGLALDDEASWDLSRDGRTLAASWVVAVPHGGHRSTVVAIDVASGERRTLASDEDFEYDAPRISPDGSRVAFGVYRRTTADDPGDVWLAVVPAAGGEITHLTRDWDRRPHSARWTPDGSALIVVADDLGRAPLWRVGAEDGRVTRLTPDDGAYSDVETDGRWIYALRATMDTPPAPVRVPIEGGAPQPLKGPVEAPAVPGRLTEVTATGADGTPIRAWLALPAGAGEDSPVPLAVFIHGGPQASWNAWSWRWNPWVLTAHGYAVLMPDPALSTGYGRDFIARGWGRWGDAPFTDLMALTDAAEARADIDASRTAALGGSFGGYMANWIAGHTDRFAAIVTHASLWSLDQFARTTDTSDYWTREMTAAMAEKYSPHHSADRISTPMLVIHGDRDYRVPIGEGLRLWWDLQSRSQAGHRFLYFPDENHWILKPKHSAIWYETVLAFLAQHIRDEEWRRPRSLG